MSSIVGGIGGAILGASIVGGGAAVYAGSRAASAAGDASRAQVAANDRAAQLAAEGNRLAIESNETLTREGIASNEALVREGIEFQQSMFDQSREDTAPWISAGKNALTSLQDKMAAGPGDFETSPGYQFRLEEGQKAIERGAAARGGLLGGAEQKALTRYGQNYATGDYDNFLRRYYDSLNPDQSLAGIGQSTATTAANQANALGSSVSNNLASYGGNLGTSLSNLGTSVGNSITSNANNLANMAISSGNAQASGSINQANAINGAVTGIANSAGTGMNNYLMWKYLNK